MSDNTYNPITAQELRQTAFAVCKGLPEDEIVSHPAWRAAERIDQLEQERTSLSFALFREANNKRQLEWPGYEQTDTAFKALEVSGEAGELAEAVKKMIRAERGIAGTTANIDEVADELADVMISADLLAAHLNINLVKAITSKFNKTSNKYGLKTLLDEGLQ